MSPEDEQKSESRTVAPRTEGPRKPYGAPRLRSLGTVNAVTLVSNEMAKKKPQG
jgi:hypothetical protein